MGVTLGSAVGGTMALEEGYVATRVDRARVDKLLAEHDPFKVDSI